VSGRDPVDRLLEGEALGAGEARELLHDASGRRRVAAEDPSALFGLLGSLPLDPPAPPAPRVAGGVDRRRRGARLARALLAGAAAASIAAAGLLVAVRGPLGPDAGEVAIVEARRAEPGSPGFGSAEGVSRVVRRLDSHTARVITVVPASTEEPTVTLILDEEIDL
jgi:hypothetical protein